MKRAKSLDLIIPFLWAFLLVVVLTGSALAQGTSFTYQGKLIEAGNPVARSCSPLRQSRSSAAINV